MGEPFYEQESTLPTTVSLSEGPEQAYKNPNVPIILKSIAFSYILPYS